MQQFLRVLNKILGFETVLNAQYPTVSDFKITPVQKKVMRSMSLIRYRNNIFRFPYELKALQKFWLHYRQPEIEGFYAEWWIDSCESFYFQYHAS